MAVDLPIEDGRAGWDEYTDTVVQPWVTILARQGLGAEDPAEWWESDADTASAARR